MRDMSTPTTFRDIIRAWPTKSALQRDLEAMSEKRAHVREWFARDRIPAKWFDLVVTAAQKRGFTQITYLALTEMFKKAPASADEAI